MALSPCFQFMAKVMFPVASFFFNGIKNRDIPASTATKGAPSNPANSGNPSARAAGGPKLHSSRASNMTAMAICS